MLKAAVYICSAGHSGSTLLDLLIGSHSRAASLGEISQLPKNIALNTLCTCGVPVRECSVWRKIGDSLNADLDIDVWTNPYALNLGPIRARIVIDKAHQTRLRVLAWKLMLGARYAELRTGLPLFPGVLHRLHEGIRNTLLLYKTVAEELDAEVVVDSTKSYLGAVGLYQKAPELMRIVQLVRDGRAVLNSGLKNNFSRAQSIAGWKHSYERSQRLFDRHVKCEHVLRVHYEDLAGNPEQVLKKICDFIGLEFEQGMLDFSSKVHHSTNGNDMRLLRSSTIKTDFSWQDNLSKEDLRYFERHAGKLNRSLGYA